MIDWGQITRYAVVNVILAFACPEFSCSQTVNGVYANQEQTIQVDKSAHEIVTTNTPETIYLSNGLIIQVNTNSDFLINNFSQDIDDTNSFPEVLKVQNSNFEGTLNRGNIFVTYQGSTNENSSCVISTPLSDHELSKGTFYLEADDNKDIEVTIDGSMKTTSGTKTTTTPGGYAVMVVQENTNGILESKNSVYTDKAKSSELKKLTQESQNITNLFIFIRIDGKTVGVLL
jgi:hypothetical protein